MLTGDNQRTADAVGRAMGADRVVAEVLPGDRTDGVRDVGQERLRRVVKASARVTGWVPEMHWGVRWMTTWMGICAVVVWVGRLVRLQRSVGRHAQFWQGSFGEDGGLLYVALGDSAAQGIGASAPQRGYVGLLAEQLRQATGRPVRVVNLSVSGAKVADVVRGQLPALALYPTADLVTVAVGGNDLRRYNAEQYAAGLTALVKALPVGPTVVADIPYFMHGHFERDAAAAAGLLSALAADRGLVVAALHEQMRAGGWRAMFTSYAADWFHPNDRGHRTWQEAFWKAITHDAPLSARLGVAST